MSIDDWRERINEIDRKLVELLNERSKCAIEIGRLKKAQNIRVYDPEREREVIRRICEENSGPLDDEGLQRLFERVIDECRRIERRESEKKT
jgi:chorismate mutase-like protein